MAYIKKCEQCGKKFEKSKGCSVPRFLSEITRYCSRECASLARRDSSPRTKKCVHCKEEFHRPEDYANKAWSDRKFCDKKCEFDYRSLDLSANSHLWKGDKVGYRQLHAWVTKHKGRPEVCEFCGKTGLKGRNAHWANVDGQYRRDLDDYIRLCVKCHSLHDRSVDYLQSKNKLSN